MELTRANTATQDGRVWVLGVRIGPVSIRQWYQSLGAAQLSGAAKSTEDLDSLIPLVQTAAADLADLVGSWRDDREVEEIVRDVYANRTA